MALGILFLAFPYSEVTHDYFPFSDQLLTLQTHVWFICNRVIFVVFAWVILNESTEFKLALQVFFGIQVLKLIDYLLCYNEVWVKVWDGVPITSNTISMLLFGLAISYEWIWRQK